MGPPGVAGVPGVDGIDVSLVHINVSFQMWVKAAGQFISGLISLVTQVFTVLHKKEKKAV